MADSKLQPLLDAAAKATPGPMTERGEGTYPMFHWVSQVESTPWRPESLSLRVTGDKRVADARFIVAAYNSVAEIQRLVSLELRLREYVGELRKSDVPAMKYHADRIESLMEGKP